MTLPLASAENWIMCDPHQLFLERAATVAPGGERAFIEAQIDAFSNRAHWLEGESQRWHRDVVPEQKTKKVGKGACIPFADFVGERAAAYRAYAQALGSALALLALVEKP